MQRVFAKTFGGLSPSYYLRQFVFALIFPAMVLFVVSQSTRPLPLPVTMYLAVNTLLYPYARFVYESVANFVIGDNVFFGNAIMMLSLKMMTMAACFSFAIFMAPLGLIYLYFYHSRREQH